ncbi:hypothetical protein K438DRAFT_1795374, partial [Mycena galopus ATCC 62051]
MHAFRILRLSAACRAALTIINPALLHHANAWALPALTCFSLLLLSNTRQPSSQTSPTRPACAPFTREPPSPLSTAHVCGARTPARSRCAPPSSTPRALGPNVLPGL